MKSGRIRSHSNSTGTERVAATVVVGQANQVNVGSAVPNKTRGSCVHGGGQFDELNVANCPMSALVGKADVPRRRLLFLLLTHSGLRQPGARIERVVNP